jgi:hypothetical protein
MYGGTMVFSLLWTVKQLDRLLPNAMKNGYNKSFAICGSIFQK